jgi:hypothetical protein
LTEGLEEAVEEDLGLAFFVAGDVLRAPAGELGEALFAIERNAGNLRGSSGDAKRCDRGEGGVMGLGQVMGQQAGNCAFGEGW